MQANRTSALLAAFALLGLAACGGDDDVADFETQEVITPTDTETVEMPVITEDTAVVETEIDIDADVDTVDVP
ncbi:MAG: hypothetical protein WD737_08055 [Gemmatimonadota bacterium]